MQAGLENLVGKVVHGQDKQRLLIKAVWLVHDCVHPWAAALPCDADGVALRGSTLHVFPLNGDITFLDL